MKNYSKREFLKILGLGIAFVPFISIYSACKSGDREEENKDEGAKNKTSTPNKNDGISDTNLDKFEPKDLVLLKRDDALFEKYQQGFNKRIKKTPKYIALCKTSLGVQQAINLAKKEQLPIAVRSGGHSFEAFSSNNDGMMINLSSMKKMAWIDKETVSLEAGCLLQEIQDELSAKKRLLPAGSCGTVGISGLTLGGGYGFFSRKFGLTCDNLVDIEFIDGEGNLSMASANKELFWALKGGGNGNFGVATRFIFKTQPMPPIFHASVLKFRGLDTNSFPEILKTWFESTKNFSQEDFSAFVLNGTTLTVLATTFGNAAPLLEKINQLSSMATSSSKSDAPLPQAMKRYRGRNGPLYFKNSSAGLYNSYEDLEAIATAIFEKVTGAKGMIFQINTLGGAINSAAFEKQSSYPHRSLGYLSELQAYWESPSQEAKLVAAFESVQALVKSKGINTQYRNYPDINFKDWEQAYFGKNYTRLQQVKQSLDPNNNFRFEQSVRLPK